MNSLASGQPSNATTSQDANLNIADAALNGGDPDMALSVSETALSHDPQNVDALYHEGAAYYATGRCMDAIAAYKVALRIDPDSSQAQTGIGRCLLKRDAAGAELAFQAAVKDDPGNAAALNDLGIARDLQGKYSAAIAPYEQALLIAPGNAGTETNLGLSLALSGDSADAIQYLGPLASGTQSTPRIREDYALALMVAGQSAQAAQVLAIDLPPGQVPAALSTYSNIIAGNQQAFSGQPAQPAATVPADPVAPVYQTATATTAPAAPVLAAAQPSPAPAALAPAPSTPSTAPMALADVPAPPSQAAIINSLQAAPLAAQHPALPISVSPENQDFTAAGQMVR